MSIIARAEQRLREEERQHELGADNRYDRHYWAAYLDGARAQLREDAAALEKQKPKPPLQACGHTTEPWMAYCPRCGQRLDWERVQKKTRKTDEVVHCGECKFFSAKSADGNSGLCCGAHAYGVYDSDYFCADGGRKEK